MLKIVYPISSGIDVHKTFVVATIASTDQKNITTYKTKRFSTFTRDLRSFAQWLSDHQCVDVCMESTGSSSWVPLSFRNRFVFPVSHCFLCECHNICSMTN